MSDHFHTCKANGLASNGTGWEFFQMLFGLHSKWCDAWWLIAANAVNLLFDECRVEDSRQGAETGSKRCWRHVDWRGQEIRIWRHSLCGQNGPDDRLQCDRRRKSGMTCTDRWGQPGVKRKWRNILSCGGRRGNRKIFSKLGAFHFLVTSPLCSPILEPYLQEICTFEGHCTEIMME